VKNLLEAMPPETTTNYEKKK